MSGLRISFWERYKLKIIAISLIAILLMSIGITILVMRMQQQKTQMLVIHAGSLTVPMEVFANVWCEIHPEFTIDNKGFGSSTAIRQITELGLKADILGSADYTLIETMMMNKPIPGQDMNYSSWYIIFARNEMGIAYIESNNPPYLTNITSGQNYWWEILNRTDVTFGRADPYQDPCGYRTLMVWGLADLLYNISKTENPQDINLSFYAKDPITGYNGAGATVVGNKEVALVSALEVGEIDYLFIYKSVATQHGLNFIELDDHVNLGNFTLETFYNNISVHRISPLLPGQSSSDKQASTIQYGLTIPNNAPNKDVAIDYLAMMIRCPGILAELGQPPYYPAYASNVSALPAKLQPFCVTYPYN
ncbi:MAG: tungstate ABC transporter substrate-binding protein WtpA [Candidatus Helarchaeota archaeon]